MSHPILIQPPCYPIHLPAFVATPSSPYHIRPFIPISRPRYPPQHPQDDFLSVNAHDSKPNDEEMIRWVRPPPGFVKINTDATIRGNGRRGFGVVVRDDQGFWVAGACGYYSAEPFDTKIGPRAEYVVQGELTAILIALNLAREKGFKGVIIESDSKKAVDLIISDQKIAKCEPKMISMVLECRRLSTFVPCCIFQHKKREGNFCADRLADIGATGDRKLRVLEEPPEEIIPYLIIDHKGVPFRRGVKVSEHDIKRICARVS